MSASSSTTSTVLPSAPSGASSAASADAPAAAPRRRREVVARGRRLAAVVRRDPWGDLARLALPLLAVAAFAAFAALQGDPAGRAETAFLALVAGGVLAAVAFVAPPPAREAGWAAVLTVALAWTIGFGPQRGAVVSACLVAALGYAVARRAAGERGLAPGLTVPAALGLQVLVRPDLLLPPLTDLRTLVSVLVLPVAAGLALSVLAGRYGRLTTALAGAGVAILAPGWNVTTTLTLVALAAGAFLAGDAVPGRAVALRPLAPTWQAIAAVALLAPLLWRPMPGLLLVAAATTLLLAGAWRPVPALVAAVLVAVAGELGGAGWATVVGAVVALAALVPVAPVAWLARGGRSLALAGTVLAVLGALAGGDGASAPGELAAPGIALLLLALPRRGAAAVLQGTWSAVLLVGTALLAAYPWVRDEPLADLRRLLGLDGTTAPLVALVAATLLVVLHDRFGRRLRLPAALPALVVAGGLALAVVAGAEPPQVVPVTYPAVVLGGERHHWGNGFGERPVRALVVDSNLVHGADLPAGTPVAHLTLLDARNRRVGGWMLRAGTHTAEWAAGRPDVAGRPGFVAPSPWLSQLSPDGTLFAQRFRARFAPRRPLAAAKVVVRLRNDLPPELRLVIYRLEVR